MKSDEQKISLQTLKLTRRFAAQLFGPKSQVPNSANNEGVFVPTFSKSHSDDEATIESGTVYPPPPGKTFEIKIFAPILGVMFYKASELQTTALRHVEQKIIDQLAERPIVTFVAGQGGAAQAGVEVGDVCLSVNGVDVSTSKAAAAEVRRGTRPLSLTFLRMADIEITRDEGFHMVKYDTIETRPPTKYSSWKPKYVVIGGIIAPPHMMMMYRSKDEYDIAVLEVTSQRKLSVKVKEFSLRGARIANDFNGPLICHHKGQLQPIKYFVIVPARGNPIKISSPKLAELRNVHLAVRRAIAESSRSSSSIHSRTPSTGIQQHVDNTPLSYVNSGAITVSTSHNNRGDSQQNVIAYVDNGYTQQSVRSDAGYPVPGLPGTRSRGRY